MYGYMDGRRIDGWREGEGEEGREGGRKELKGETRRGRERGGREGVSVLRYSNNNQGRSELESYRVISPSRSKLVDLIRLPNFLLFSVSVFQYMCLSCVYPDPRSSSTHANLFSSLCTFPAGGRGKNIIVRIKHEREICGSLFYKMPTKVGRLGRGERGRKVSGIGWLEISKNTRKRCFFFKKT